MKIRTLSLLSSLLTLVLALDAVPARAGGAWVPDPGKGDVELGISRKTADTSWDSKGHAFLNRSGGGARTYHDFRYAYLSGDLGVVRRLSFRFVFTYLDGREGPLGAEEVNKGLSDAWIGLKYGLKQGDWPMAVAATMRTSYLYDIPQGTYNRHLFDSNGKVRGVSPEWRGLLKEDYTLSYLVSHSYADGRGWLNLEGGYTWRVGAPADEIPLYAEAAYPLPFWHASIKGTALFVHGLGNDSPKRFNDRFGANSTFNFNDASVLRGGIGILAPVGTSSRWSFEVGYNHWLWGRSARRYREPYISVGRRF